MGRIGSRFRELQARTLGQYSQFEPHGSNKGPGVNNYVDAGGTATDNGPFTTLSHDGTSDATANSAITTRASGFLNRGLLVIYNAWHTNQPIGNLAGEYAIGCVTLAPNALVEDWARFNPGAGDATAGNIQVRTSSTDHNGSITYPSLDQGSIYTSIVIDNDRDETRFFIGDNPFFDQPAGTIDFTPNEIAPVGGTVESTGTDATEELRMSLSGYIYVP